MPTTSVAMRKPRKGAAVSKKPRKNERRKLELIKRLTDTNSYEIKSRILHASDNYWKLDDLVFSAKLSYDARERWYEDAKRALRGARKALEDAEQTLSEAVENRDRAQKSLFLVKKMDEARQAIEVRNESERALTEAETRFKKWDDFAISLTDQMEESELDSFFGVQAQVDNEK
ncbi:hypothetical protein HG530_010789 [Fusarium avenaceum]|nr:hypothetical protein HG530_010789 [Fusarium avenaceum]KIL94121.1 hypothetical protein FAVG1_02683 [Fusarium avenaceum]